MMGLMMLGRMLMYFTGDLDSWDMRSLMIGMMRGGMGGMGMGGVGGMGGMGGMMGGGMRSVPPTGLPFAGLEPGQTRRLPTRLVSLSPPDPERGVRLPEKGERLQVGDVADVTDDARVQKALRRLAADKASTTLSQLVMWRLGAKLEWDVIAALSEKWANRYELALAQDFVDHLDTLPDGETGRLLFAVEGTNVANAAIAAQVSQTLQQKMVLGLIGEIRIPAHPEGPGVYCRVRITDDHALVQVGSSDAEIQNWVPFGKFSLPLTSPGQTFDAAHFIDALAQGVLNRLVRTQLTKGPREKGKQTYRIRIDNASPLILNGLAAVGATANDGQTPRILSAISLPPRKSMTVPASEELVTKLGLKKGLRVVALDLSAL